MSSLVFLKAGNFYIYNFVLVGLSFVSLSSLSLAPPPHRPCFLFSLKPFKARLPRRKLVSDKGNLRTIDRSLKLELSRDVCLKRARMHPSSTYLRFYLLTYTYIRVTVKMYNLVILVFLKIAKQIDRQTCGKSFRTTNDIPQLPPNRANIIICKNIFDSPVSMQEYIITRRSENFTR